MGRSKKRSCHFDRVASKYAHVRNTDPDVVEAIIHHLPTRSRPVDLVDIGCGTGRYTDIIARRFKGDLRLLCCDYSAAMIAECRTRMSRGFPSKDIHYCRVSASDLSFADACIDAIVTFNAVHHFDLDRFVIEASRVLRRGGLLSIYTRTPEQNARTVWGEHFPGFAERETRLYPSERLEEAIGSVSELRSKGIREFTYVRKEPPDSLLNRARHFHYSTFALYSKNEFKRAVAKFARRLSKLSVRGLVEHTAANTLVLVRKT